MKVKTSVTLSPELLAAIDKVCHGDRSRSDFLEEVAWTAIRHRRREELDAKDRALHDKYADVLNAEMDDVLRYQADPPGLR